MFLFSLILSLLALSYSLPSTTAIIISYADGPPGSRTTTQVCNPSSPHAPFAASSICCIPLDLNIVDGRSYGWFRAAQVAFIEIIQPDTFTAVYARPEPGTHRLPCSGEIITHQTGNRPWGATRGLGKWGAGSALAYSMSATGTEGGLKRMYPDLIIVEGRKYRFHMKGVHDIRWYRDNLGNFVFGKEFLEQRVGRMRNGTVLEGGVPERDEDRSVT